jgi:sulfur-carrier protein
MPITVELPRALQPYAHGQTVVVLDRPVATVADALGALEDHWPGVVDRVLTEQRAVRQHVNVFVDEENIRDLDGLQTQLPSRCTITILAAVSGG